MNGPALPIHPITVSSTATSISLLKMSSMLGEPSWHHGRFVSSDFVKQFPKQSLKQETKGRILSVLSYQQVITQTLLI